MTASEAQGAARRLCLSHRGRSSSVSQACTFARRVLYRPGHEPIGKVVFFGVARVFRLARVRGLHQECAARARRGGIAWAVVSRHASPASDSPCGAGDPAGRASAERAARRPARRLQPQQDLVPAPRARLSGRRGAERRWVLLRPVRGDLALRLHRGRAVPAAGPAHLLEEAALRALRALSAVLHDHR